MLRRQFISFVASLLLSVWYLMAVVGFDVHYDHHDEEVFIVSLLCRTDCESIHPLDECHCIDHHLGQCHSDDEDCENEISILSLTGDGHNYVCDYVPSSVYLMTVDTPIVFIDPIGNSHNSFLHESPPRERLRRICILRV